MGNRHRGLPVHRSLERVKLAAHNLAVHATRSDPIARLPKEHTNARLSWTLSPGIDV